MNDTAWHPADELNSQYRTFVDSAFHKQNVASSNWPVILVIYFVMMFVFLFLGKSDFNPLYFIFPLLLLPILGIKAKKANSSNYDRVSAKSYEWREGNFTKARYASRHSRYIYVDDLKCSEFPLINRYRIPTGAKMLVVRLRNPDGTFHHYAISMDKLNQSLYSR